ncbi:MAG: recombinase family protein [Holosporales bacterium]|jgi:DNA invertase Pin-like site-specific DNA recombinase|nr:recombinase family protein [Holosporales bacterium]
MKIGYARVSTPDQNLDVQLEALQGYGCELIFSEKYTGTVFERTELDKCLNKLRKGDTLVFYKLDRLGRSLREILKLLDRLKSEEIDFISIRDNISTTGPYAELMTNILGAFAQFERDIIVERTSTGRHLAKEKGVKFGRKEGKVNVGNEPKIDVCAKLYVAGSTLNQIRVTLGIKSLETIYRYLQKKGIEPNRKKMK